MISIIRGSSNSNSKIQQGYYTLVLDVFQEKISEKHGKMESSRCGVDRRAAERRPRGSGSRQGACPAGCTPPLSSSQSPLSSISACGENCARSLAPPLPTARSAAGAPFRSCPKRKRAVHGPKEKGAKRAPVQWPSARDGGRRIGACSDFALPSGTLSPSAIPVTAVPWRMVQRASGWSSH